MTDTTHADELRAAAKLMRERAEAATPGPWVRAVAKWNDEQFGAVLAVDSRVEDPSTWIMATGRRDSERIHGDANSTFAASMHPLVALAVADLLDAMADDSDPFPLRYPQALAVARAYLGTEDEGEVPF